MTKFLMPLCFICLWTQIGKSQVQIQPIPIGGISQGNTISLSNWQWQIQANQHLGEPVFIRVKIRNAKGEMLYQIAGHTFQLGATTTFTGNQFNEAETEIIAPNLKQLNCLPKGKYTIESTLYLIHAEPLTAIAQSTKNWIQRTSCMTSIFSVSPTNGATICETYPLFQWTAARQITGVYEFRLYEQQSSQNTLQATTQNKPIVKQTSSLPQFRYSPADFPLEKGQRYTWQILNKIGEEVVGHSRVYSFQYGCLLEKQKKVFVKHVPKIYLKTGQLGASPTYTLTAPILNFSFKQQVAKDNIQLQIKNEEGNTLVQQPITTKKGQNYLSFTFDELGLPQFQQGQQYWVCLSGQYQKKRSFSIYLDKM